MKCLRFSDVCASGFARGKRVFIRSDLNVPLDDAGRIISPQLAEGQLLGGLAQGLGQFGCIG